MKMFFNIKKQNIIIEIIKNIIKIPSPKRW